MYFKLEEYNPSIDRFKQNLSLQITQNFYPKELIFILNQLKRRTLQELPQLSFFPIDKKNYIKKKLLHQRNEVDKEDMYKQQRETN